MLGSTSAAALGTTFGTTLTCLLTSPTRTPPSSLILRMAAGQSTTSEQPGPRSISYQHRRARLGITDHTRLMPGRWVNETRRQSIFMTYGLLMSAPASATILFGAQQSQPGHQG